MATIHSISDTWKFGDRNVALARLKAMIDRNNATTKNNKDIKLKAIAIYISAILVLTSNICGESFANSSKATTMQRNQIDQILNKADDRLARLDTNAIQLLNKANSMLRGANINALSYRISLAYGNYYKIKNEFKLSAENYYRAL